MIDCPEITPLGNDPRIKFWIKNSEGVALQSHLQTLITVVHHQHNLGHQTMCTLSLIICPGQDSILPVNFCQ